VARQPGAPVAAVPSTPTGVPACKGPNLAEKAAKNTAKRAITRIGIRVGGVATEKVGGVTGGTVDGGAATEIAAGVGANVGNVLAPPCKPAAAVPARATSSETKTK
jgi:hypothetical protein